MSSKIIVYGDINGQVSSAFKKLATLHAKNSFAFAIVAGNLFSDDDDPAIDELLNNRVEIPLPVYFTISTNPFPQRVIEKLEKDGDLCDNLHFLGKRTTTTTSEGVRIVTLGGQLDTAIIGGLSQDKFLPFHTVGDAKVLHGANSADILLTTCWPSSIQKYSQTVLPEGITPPEGSEHISDLCAALKPRYHFTASSGFAYEREPFFHTPSEDTPDFKPVTRFISLAAYGNSTKAKAQYAFSLSRAVDQTLPMPPGTTIVPFMKSKKRTTQDSGGFSRYHDDRNGHREHKRSRGRKGERQPPPGPGECFFCLSNPTLATHLISSIGDDAYLTMSKGPLTTADTYKNMGLDFPAHTIIIPLSHSPTLASIAEEDDARRKTWTEMNRFKAAIQSMVADRSNNQLGVVTFEISKRRGVHTHWQCLPMPADMIRKNLVEAAFKVEAENRSYPQFDTRDPGLSENEEDFIRVWIWTPPTSEDGSQGTTKCITMAFDDDLRFDLQFGRAVLGKLLGVEKRIHWRDCEQTVEEETKETSLFKEAFKDFDFTL